MVVTVRMPRALLDRIDGARGGRLRAVEIRSALESYYGLAKVETPLVGGGEELAAEVDRAVAAMERLDKRIGRLEGMAGID